MKRHLLLLSPLLVIAGACSSEPEPVPPQDDSAAAPSSASGAATPPASPTPPVDANTLTLEGLGDLRIGEPVPAGSTWAQRGAQVPGECRTISSPDYPGVYAIVEQDKVRRITLGERSTVELVEGIGTGASEQTVLAAFPFPVTPHKYLEAPAKYLTAPSAERGEPALRFEIDRDGKVSLIHVGTMPVLGYVEGCS